MIAIEHLYRIFQSHPRVVTDSRQVEPGCLFFALRGDRFNGNHFAAAALEQGAAFAVVDDPDVCRDERFLLTPDVLITLQRLAGFHRQNFQIPVIALTGSNGKTTTKELIAAVLGIHYPAHFTRGNLNNHIGVPLTLLAMTHDVEVAVVEMGANHQGEIDALCRIAMPTHGLVTNIGKAHLEGFGGIEGVKKGKSELYRYLAKTGGVAFINKDEPFLEELAAPVEKKIFYARNDRPDPKNRPIEVQLVSEQPALHVAFLDETGQMLEVHSRLIGMYNFSNIMTAIALGKYFKVPGKKIKKAIEAYVPANNRSQILEKDGRRYILDAYNANPSSMELALRNFAAMEDRHKLAILGDMLELGGESAREHLYIAGLAASLGIPTILVGPEFAPAARQLNLPHFEDVDRLRQWLSTSFPPADLILLKVGRGG
jgi:UDP-N-acetylmuramoyl-tripeptide--D-alanyl-D-alanine ligase